MKKLLAALVSALLLMLAAGACANASKQSPAEKLMLEEMGAKEFSVPDMNEEQQKFYDQYVEQLLLSSMLMNSWSATDTSALSADPSGARSDSMLMLAFEDIVGGEEMPAMWKQYNGKFPEKIVEDVLSVFPYSTEQLHEILANHYDAAEKVYNYEGGRGGGPIDCAVTDVKTLDDKSVEVSYSVFSGYDDEATMAGGNKVEMYTTIQDGRLTLKPEADGKYSYLSASVNGFWEKMVLGPTKVASEP